MMLISVQEEISEMSKLEKMDLDNNEMQVKKQELAQKLMEK